MKVEHAIQDPKDSYNRPTKKLQAMFGRGAAWNPSNTSQGQDRVKPDQKIVSDSRFLFFFSFMQKEGLINVTLFFFVSG